MMKRFLQHASWSDPEIERSLSLISEAMEDVQNSWPCVKEIRDCIVQAQQAQTSMPPEDPLNAPDLMNGLELVHDEMPNLMASLGEDLGTLITDEFLSTQLQVAEPRLESFDFNQPLGP